MSLNCRSLLRLGASGATVFVATKTAGAQTYPSRPVRLVVPFPPGGVVDLYGRLIGQKLSDRLGQPFIIENRPGAGGNIGTEFVARAVPDGYTLLMITSTNSWNVPIYEKLTFDFIRDITPISTIYYNGGILGSASLFSGEICSRTDFKRKGESRKGEHAVGRNLDPHSTYWANSSSR